MHVWIADGTLLVWVLIEGELHEGEEIVSLHASRGGALSALMSAQRRYEEKGYKRHWVQSQTDPLKFSNAQHYFRIKSFVVEK